jgi:DNA-binding NtrC family response regulator
MPNTSDWLERALSRAGVERAAGVDPPRVLLVDDSPVNLGILTETLRPLGYSLLVATDGERAMKVAKRGLPALVLLDVMMPEVDGFEVCRRMKQDPELRDIPIVFCSALHDSAARVTGLELGAVDFITKPFDPAEVVARVRTHLALHSLLQGLEQRNRELERELAFARDARQEMLRRMQEVLVGSSEPVRELRSAVAALGRTLEPVLLVSDAGCGDEAVARAIHEASLRRDRPFLRIECPLLRAADVPGIFRAVGGAPHARTELARGGTIFFEGIHRMPVELQLPLFSLIDANDAAAAEGKPDALDVRILCSTITSLTGTEANDVLELWRNRARSRKTLRLPTLAERRDDIPALVAFFVDRHARLVGRTIDSVSNETLRELARHWWPGNLRELEEVVRSGVLRSQRSTLEIDARQLTDGIPFGSYRLLRKLSEGGMGTIWEAQHRLLARPAVVKLIRGQLPGARRMLERRFELEARATAKLRCPNTVTLFDYGISDEGDFYYVMEKLEGTDLEQAVEKFGPMPPARVVHLLMQACRSLAEAHQSGLVHRDIKPANLFLCKLGLDVDVLKVLDFGVVKWAAGDDDQAAPIPADLMAGTPAYMAPEASLNPASIDGRVDIYALGCVAYWMLTGALPFEAPSPTAVVMKHVLEQPEPPSRRSMIPISKALEQIVMRCLAKAPADRPDALELHEALRATHLAEGWTPSAAVEWWEANLTEVVHAAQPSIRASV